MTGRKYRGKERDEAESDGIDERADELHKNTNKFLTSKGDDLPSFGTDKSLPQGTIERDTHLRWTQEEAKRFFEAFQRHGTDWSKVSVLVETKSFSACEALYRNFRSFLSLPKSLLNVTAFLAVVKDSLKMEESNSDTVSEGSACRASECGEGDSGKLPASKGRRSVRVATREASGAKVGAAMHSKEVSTSPMWGGRRPRARQMQTPPSDGAYSHSCRPRPYRAQSTEPGDAEGIDALLSLAAVAQEASQENETGGLEDGQPVRSQRRSKGGLIVEDTILNPAARSHLHSPPSRKRASSGQRVKSPVMDPMPPRTPSSRNKQDKAKKAFAGKLEGSTTAKQEGASQKAEGLPQNTVAADDRLRHSSRTRRRGKETEEEDHEVMPVAKRTRKSDSEERTVGDVELEEANLEAEKEDLDDEEDEVEDFDWSSKHSDPMPRRRRRKPVPEKMPPMMASAKALFARRSSLALAAPPPAFLLGVPPPSSRMSGVETEGQTVMGPAELRLRYSLDPRVRRWCMYEFFYSAVDRPWFMRNELANYLSHVGIPMGTKLTRPEMAIIKASLGQPRRLSLTFLRQERLKLEAWREKVRDKYTEVGPGAEVPTDLPRQLQVGQRVTARHPITRQLHDGDVLTVAANSYRVQFDRRELGVELVKDADVMPSDPAESLPVAMLQALPTVILNGRQMGRGPIRQESNDGISVPWTEHLKEAMPLTLQESGPFPQIPSAIRTLADMKAALDTKEMLLAQLKRMNDEVDAGMHKEVNGQRPEAFQKAYAQVLIDLQMMNKLLDSSSFGKQLPSISPAPEVCLQHSLPPAPQVQPGHEQSVLKHQSDTSPASPQETIWQDASEIVARVHSQNEPAPESTSALAGLVTGCVCLLISLHRYSGQSSSSPTVEGSINKALQAIQPHSQVNECLFSSVEKYTSCLKVLLQAGADMNVGS